MEQRKYQEAIEEIGGLALSFLQDMERALEEFHIRELPRYQQPIREKYPDLWLQAQDRLSRLSPPPELASLHQLLLEACAHLKNSCEIFSHPYPSEGYIDCIRGAYHEVCWAKCYLYQLRTFLPGFRTYWVTEEARDRLDQIEVAPHPSLQVPVGLLFKDWDDQQTRYALYVPEYYDPQRSWPLIVCLHGGGGRDDDIIWLWLKHAKSQGFLLVAPKSIDMTWMPKDAYYILKVIQEIRSFYQIEEQGIFLTGVSDGGTFTYEVGMRNPHLFAGLAPVSGGMMPWFDFEKARHLPIYILHGARDTVISVDFARQARGILENFGNPLVYRELPDWGHAIPFQEMGHIRAWFEQILREKELQSNL
ncbi:MAG: hypothetical protein HYY20_08235 [Candidatus Tectomicrobia bacterium]|uniref:Phospholipase/carboxylesterase/thioesterase domain-containing protein n=1 Tax=Tectimicrobiota bacterium TaxID=2528274 RepID=A0A932FYW0_UNCTE|nr:hypothetical protein [Candidatus Tectomicrobia bacterium]